MAKLVAISYKAQRNRNFFTLFYKNLEQMINSITDQNQIITELKLLPGNIN